MLTATSNYESSVITSLCEHWQVTSLLWASVPFSYEKVDDTMLRSLPALDSLDSVLWTHHCRIVHQFTFLLGYTGLE